MRLGEKQKEILNLMNNGWELGRNLTMQGNYWLQKGGCGRGGETKHDISPDSVHGIYKKGLIRVNKKSFPLETYELTGENYE